MINPSQPGHTVQGGDGRDQKSVSDEKSLKTRRGNTQKSRDDSVLRVMIWSWSWYWVVYHSSLSHHHHQHSPRSRETSEDKVEILGCPVRKLETSFFFFSSTT